MPKRKAEAQWEGALQGGNGSMRMASGSYEGPFSYQSRFEESDGTNPEELIAAAHAGCFSMAFAHELDQAGHDPQSVETSATVTLDGLDITSIELDTRARVPGIDEDEFQRIANAAKEGCPVSKALGGVGSIEVKAELTQ